MLKVKLVHPKAILPTRATQYAAGVDLYSVEDVMIDPGTTWSIRTGIKISIPDGTYFRIAPRSGLAKNYGLDVLAGVVDCDYRGEIVVLLHNTGPARVNIVSGMRIAQGIIEQIHTFTPVEVDELDETDRGSNGFGSTGNWQK
jgi:dUTP pyrophosphatase